VRSAAALKQNGENLMDFLSELIIDCVTRNDKIELFESNDKLFQYKLNMYINYIFFLFLFFFLMFSRYRFIFAPSSFSHFSRFLQII